MQPESGMVAHTCNPAPGGERQEDQEFKANLDYIWNWRPARSTWDPVFKTLDRKKLTLRPVPTWFPSCPCRALCSGQMEHRLVYKPHSSREHGLSQAGVHFPPGGKCEHWSSYFHEPRHPVAKCICQQLQKSPVPFASLFGNLASILLLNKWCRAYQSWAVGKRLIPCCTSNLSFSKSAEWLSYI